MGSFIKFPMENPKQVLGKLEAMSDPDFMEKLFDIDSLGAKSMASGVVPPYGRSTSLPIT